MLRAAAAQRATIVLYSDCGPAKILGFDELQGIGYTVLLTGV